MCRDCSQTIAVIGYQDPVCDAAEAMRLVQHRVEYRHEVTRRTVDDLEDLGGGRLLVERLARLGDEPAIFDGDDSLCREILQQRNLPVREWPHLLPGRNDLAG